MSIYHTVDDAILLCAEETGSSLSSMPVFATEADLINSAPSSPQVLGYVHFPAITHTRTNGKGYAVGTPFAVYDKKGTVTHSLTLDMRLASLNLLPRLMRPSGGYKNLADLCFYYGVIDSEDDGYIRALRYAKCSEFTMAFTEGSGQELSGKVAFTALYDHEATGIAPTTDEIRAAGAPLFWSNVISISITNENGTREYRDRISSLSVTGNNNLSARGSSVDYGDQDARSRSNLALVPTNFTGKAQLTLHAPLDAELLNATANATVWGNITVTATNAGTQPDDENAKTLTVILHNCIAGTGTHTAAVTAATASAPGAAPLTGTVDISYSNISVIYTQ